MSLNTFSKINIPQKININQKMIDEENSLTNDKVWKNDLIGSGMKNTQQLNVDWSDFSQHVFFNSAEGKVNLTFDTIINQYPFDGTTEEKEIYLHEINGYTKHILEKFSYNYGYLKFDGNVYIPIKDVSGALAPELAKKVGNILLTKEVHISGCTFETWIQLDSSTYNSNNQIIYQKYDENTFKGITIYRSGPNEISFLISSDEFKSIKSSLTIPDKEWTHIAFVYYRGASERIVSYVNGKLGSSTQHQAELEDILLGTETVYIGYGIPHVQVLGGQTTSVVEPLVGWLDELRFWNKTRSALQIEDKMLKNCNQQSGLILSYRFNEPNPLISTDLDEFNQQVPWEYGSKYVVLDYSGNSFHSTISLINPNIQTYIEDIRGFYSENEPNPVILEYSIDNIILFPDWIPTIKLNNELILEGNHYDRNNPNIITNLVPKHYFEEAQYFEGLANDLEDPEGISFKNVTNPLPGHGQMPTKVLLMSFLMIWATYFDEMKLWIDSFSNINKVDYDGFNQIPTHIIDFIAKYYGIELPNPYSNEKLSRYYDGVNLENDPSKKGSLKTINIELWKRLLINLPYLLRSRGTVQGIRALFNTLGLEDQSFFKFKEFGGNITKKISTSNKIIKKNIGWINCSSPSYNSLTIEDFYGYRHSQGLPDPSGAPFSEILVQAGDIFVFNNQSDGIATLLTSGSWNYECFYKFNEDLEDQAEIFSIIDNDNVVIKLENNFYESGIRDIKLSILDSSDTTYNEILLTNVDFKTDINYYFSISQKLIDTKILYTIDVRTVSAENILNEWKHEEYVLKTDISQKLFNFNNLLIPSVKILPFKGKLTNIRWWNYALSEKEKYTHCKNILSEYSEKPFYKLFIDNLPLIKYSGTYSPPLVENAWERLVCSYNMFKINYDTNTSTGVLIDSSQNMFNLILDGANSDFIVQLASYKITNPDFDTSGTDNKVRVRSYMDEVTADREHAFYGNLTKLPSSVGLEDRRFSIESSIIGAINEDIINVLGNITIMNNLIGAPEYEYAVEYTELNRYQDLYFQRLEDKLNFTYIIEFQRWFNNNFADLVVQFIPYTADFLGINFVIESHILERHKYEYKQGDIHVDIRNRSSIESVRPIIGTIRSEII